MGPHHIRRCRYTCTPLEFCQRFLNENLVKHLRKNMANTAVLVGDLNDTLKPTAKEEATVNSNLGRTAQDEPTLYTVFPFINLTLYLLTG